MGLEALTRRRSRLGIPGQQRRGAGIVCKRRAAPRHRRPEGRIGDLQLEMEPRVPLWRKPAHERDRQRAVALGARGDAVGSFIHPVEAAAGWPTRPLAGIRGAPNPFSRVLTDSLFRLALPAPRRRPSLRSASDDSTAPGSSRIPHRSVQFGVDFGGLDLPIIGRLTMGARHLQ
jgi:hypothetical protein